MSLIFPNPPAAAAATPATSANNGAQVFANVDFSTGQLFGQPNTASQDGISIAPGVTAGASQLQQTLRRRNEAQNGTSQVNINVQFGGVSRICLPLNRINATFQWGFDAASAFYDSAQGAMIGFFGSFPSAAALTGVTGNNYYTATNISSICAACLDFGSNTWQLVSKIGTAAASVQSFGISRQTNCIYRLVLWKDQGAVDMNATLYRSNPTTGAVAESASLTIPNAQLPTAVTQPVVMCCSTSPLFVASISFISMSASLY